MIRVKLNQSKGLKLLARCRGRTSSSGRASSSPPPAPQIINRLCCFADLQIQLQRVLDGVSHPLQDPRGPGQTQGRPRRGERRSAVAGVPSLDSPAAAGEPVGLLAALGFHLRGSNGADSRPNLWNAALLPPASKSIWVSK